MSPRGCSDHGNIAVFKRDARVGLRVLEAPHFVAVFMVNPVSLIFRIEPFGLIDARSATTTRLRRRESKRPRFCAGVVRVVAGPVVDVELENLVADGLRISGAPRERDPRGFMH